MESGALPLSPELDRHRDDQWQIWEAARATSAAPIYFLPFEKDGARFRDGGVGFNNPTELAVDRLRAAGQDIDIVVSLGTGRLPKAEENRFHFGATSGAMKMLVIEATASEPVHLRMKTKTKVAHYCRFNFPLRHAFELDTTNAAKLQSMERSASIYMHTASAELDVALCAARLALS